MKLFALVFQNQQNPLYDALGFSHGKVLRDQADFLGIGLRILHTLHDFIAVIIFFLLAQRSGNQVYDILVFLRNEPLDKIQGFLIQGG